MATFSLNDSVRRTVATGDGSNTGFSFSFQINQTSNIKIYVDGVLKSEGSGSTNYVVQDGSGNAGLSSTGTGKVIFGTAPANGTAVTILSDIPLARSSLYSAGGNVTASALENDFDILTMALGDREERDTRSLQAPVNDPIDINMTMPKKADRLGKMLGFNSSTGNPEAVNNITTSAVTVSTVSVGGNATASVSTSGNTATFAFGIPTGATGATGSAGADGADGADGSGTFDSFTVAGSSGSNQTITNGNTLTIAGGAGITTTASATDTVTIAVTADPIAFAIGLG